MHIRFVHCLLLSISLIALPASANDSAEVRADDLMAALKLSDYDQAARKFHYPESYTPAKLAEDRKNVANCLHALFHEIGDIQAFSRSSEPKGEFLTFAFGGGDVPYWRSHPNFNAGMQVTYLTHVRNEGNVYVIIALVHLQRGWETRSIALELPKSTQATKRLREIESKVLGPALLSGHSQ